jgi:hypothetical protein
MQAENPFTTSGPAEGAPVRPSRVKWMPGSVFVVVGLGLLVASAFIAARTNAFLARAAHADGVVIDLSAGSQHPSVEFTLPSGEKRVFAGGGWLSGYRLQRRVGVLYSPESPVSSATLDDPGAVWFDASFTALLGGGQVLAGLLAMFVRPKEK